MAQPRRNSDSFSEADSGDFIVRRRILPVWQLLLLFFLSFMVLFIVATNADMLGGAIGLGLAIFAVIGPLTWFTVYFSQQNRDMLLAAEFQNALFSAAARLKTKFVMIVKQDGTIFYFDRGFQRVFPETNSRGTLMIDKIFNSKQISTGEADKLFRALEEGTSETVFVHLQSEESEEAQKVIVTIDPLPRPSGFYILRGRDYVVKRLDRGNAQSNTVKMSDNEQVSATVNHMLDSLPYGLYTTDSKGNILFMNYRLTDWLGYLPNEVINKKLSLIDIVPQQNTATAENILVKDCEGEVQFKNKTDQLVQLHIQQEITRDAGGNVVGTVAIVRPEQPANMDLVTKNVMESARENEAAPTLSPSLIAGKKF
jgi:PAS domain S-box-containing protein